MLDKDFHGITIRFEEHWACITTDQRLVDFLKGPGNGSVELAAYVLGRYPEIFHRQLKISKMSLAVEILIHAYLDVLSQNSAAIQERLPEPVSKPIRRFMAELHGKTSTIDCGESPVDHNRFVFDDLAPFHSLIFAVLGSLA